MCDCDCEMPEFFDMRFVKAKKEHKCCECYAPILAGHEYEYICGKWVGDFIIHKTCMRCSRLRAEFNKKPNRCVCFEGLMEALQDWDEPLPQDYVERRDNLIQERKDVQTKKDLLSAKDTSITP